MELLPAELKENEKSWMSSRCDMSLWEPVLEVLANRHGLTGLPLKPYSTGSAVVVAIGKEAVIKIFQPADLSWCHREIAALTITGEGLSIPTPPVLASGEFEECPYLVMGQLHGHQLTTVWESMDDQNHIEILASLGTIAKSLHKLPLTGNALSPVIKEMKALTIDWQTFMEEQISTASQRQRDRQLDERWCRQIDPFISKHHDMLLSQGTISLLHTELMTDHLLVEQRNGSWQISGFFDFADSLIGDCRYELPSVGLFVSSGKRHLLRAFFQSYGLDGSEFTEELSQNLMAWTLCHKYCHIPWYLKRNGPSEDETSLEHLALRWFGL